jgi:hypothetical protein
MHKTPRQYHDTNLPKRGGGGMKYYEVIECKYHSDIVGSIVTIESDFKDIHAPYYWGWMTVVKGKIGIFGTITLPHNIHDRVLLKEVEVIP